MRICKNFNIQNVTNIVHNVSGSFVFSLSSHLTALFCFSPNLNNNFRVCGFQDNRTRNCKAGLVPKLGDKLGDKRVSCCVRNPTQCKNPVRFLEQGQTLSKQVQAFADDRVTVSVWRAVGLLKKKHKFRSSFRGKTILSNRYFCLRVPVVFVLVQTQN